MVATAIDAPLPTNTTTGETKGAGGEAGTCCRSQAENTAVETGLYIKLAANGKSATETTERSRDT